MTTGAGSLVFDCWLMGCSMLDDVVGYMIQSRG